jgi:hypothetical protein
MAGRTPGWRRSASGCHGGKRDRVTRGLSVDLQLSRAARRQPVDGRDGRHAELFPRALAPADPRPGVRRRGARSSQHAAVGHHPGLRPLAAYVQRRSQHRRAHDPHEPDASAAPGRRHDASRNPVPPGSGRRERTQLRPERARRLLVRRGARRIAPGQRCRKRTRAPARRGDACGGANRNRRGLRWIGAVGFGASGHQCRRDAGAGRPRSRRPETPRAAVRFGDAPVFHRLRQRCRAAPDARTAAASRSRSTRCGRRSAPDAGGCFARH